MHKRRNWAQQRQYEIREYLGWEPSIRLRNGIARTYEWIEKEMLAIVHA